MVTRAEALGFLSDLAPSLGVPKDIAQRVAITENAPFDPRAVSPAGAIGLMQLMPDTAKQYGVDPYDWKQNVLGGLKYLAALKRQFGSWPLALRAYNAGPGRVSQSYGFPETNDYVAKVMNDPALAQALNTTRGAQAGAATDPLISRLLTAQKAAQGQREAAATSIDKSAEQARSIAAEPLPAIPSAPKMEELPTPPKFNLQEPMKVFGQFMPLLVAFGALASRGGGTAALKAATAAMNAQRSNDIDGFEKARQEWIDQSQQVATHNANVAEEFRTVLENTRLSMDEKTARLQAIAAANGMTAQAEALRSGNLTDLENITGILENSAKNIQQLALQQRQLQMDDTRLELQKRGLDVAEERVPLVNKVYEDALKAGKSRDEAINEAAQAAAGLNVKGRMAAEHQIRQELEKGPVGKAYAQLDQFGKVIEEAKDTIKSRPLSAAEQNAFVDAFQKIITGGNAIRGFQLKMNMEHGGLADKAARMTQQLGRGGPLSPRMVEDMVNITEQYAKDLNAEYQGELSRAQKYAESNMMTAEGVTPFSYGGGVGIDLAGPSPLPAKKEDLVPGQTYQTAHGPATWDGTEFTLATPGG